MDSLLPYLLHACIGFDRAKALQKPTKSSLWLKIAQDVLETKIDKTKMLVKLNV